MNLYFTCADIVIELKGDLPKAMTEDVKEYFLFEKPDVEEIAQWTFESVEELGVVQAMPVYQDMYRIILNENGKESRIYTEGTGREPYAVYRDTGATTGYIQYLGRKFPAIDMRFMEMLVLEKHLLAKKALILHSCFVEHEGEGIVFTAPSGTGKSTQGGLWEQYAQAEIINGDRCVLQCKEDGVYVCGLPFCGSSVINTNKIMPLKAIVVVKQAKENVAVKLPAGTAIKKLMSETTMNYWNPEFLDKSISLIEEVVMKQGVLELSCTISEEAVNALKSAI